jgi:hypothetical protein
MGGAFEDGGTVTVPSGSDAVLSPTGLEPFTRYERQITVTNDSGRSRTGPGWTFTTGADGAINQPPTATAQSLSMFEDGTVPITLAGSDPDGNPLSYSIVNGPTHGTLTGVAPALTYQPAANYSGGDSFTFRVNDGQADSPFATVAIAVQAINDAPVATGESYTVQSGATLTVTAPGLLSNDTDIDSVGLTTVLGSVPAHGALTLNANGAFSYVPSPGYSGPDTFSYAASDGMLSSTLVTVSLTVTAPPPPPPPGPVFSANFNTSSDSFTYADNVFRGATQSGYASGSRVSSGGFTGGALRVLVGGVNKQSITSMSGGWTRTFTLSAPATLTLTFRYNMSAGSDYESDDLSQVLASLNGVLKGASPNDYVAQVSGNGNGGAAIATGWQLMTIPVGTLPAGTHTLTLGGYNNKKDSKSEMTTILIDDVLVERQP